MKVHVPGVFLAVSLALALVSAVALSLADHPPRLGTWRGLLYPTLVMGVALLTAVIEIVAIVSAQWVAAINAASSSAMLAVAASRRSRLNPSVTTPPRRRRSSPPP